QAPGSPPASGPARLPARRGARWTSQRGATADESACTTWKDGRVATVNPPRGMRDFLPADKARRERVLAVIRERYRAHGFDEIETPVVEEYDRLHAGIGGDNEKLSYNILRRGLDADAIRQG